MTSLNCFRACGLMDARAAGLSEAERLVLETHVAGCSACSETSAALRGLVSIAQSAPAVLNEAGRRRVIARALLQGERKPARAVAAFTFALASWRSVAVAAVLLLAVGWWAWPQKSSSNIASVQTFNASRAETIDVDGAQLELAAGTRVDWEGEKALVTLRGGALKAVVTPREGKPPFVVETAAFRVVVVGTAFEVTPDSVAVTHGVVRIESPAGLVLREALRAGERWNRHAVAATPEEDDVAAVAAVVESGLVKVASGQMSGTDVSQVLALARSRLAAGDVSAARRALERLHGLNASVTQRAEADTLKAESFQVEGKLARAIALYQDVARNYRSIGAGDNAAYAAAQLTFMRGDHDAAAKMFKGYLRDRPQGRFREEALRALVEIERVQRGSVAK